VGRRMAAFQNRECWYCHRHLHAHTCKHAETSRFSGWAVDPPVRLEDNGSVGWRTAAVRYFPVPCGTIMDRTVEGVGLTRDMADMRCFAAIARIDPAAAAEPPAESPNLS
jgi:hypothetical protein